MIELQKIIRQISQGDFDLGTELLEQGTHWRKLEKTGAGYKDTRFTEFTLQYTKVKGGWVLTLTDNDTGKAWEDKGLVCTLKECAEQAGRIICSRYEVVEPAVEVVKPAVEVVKPAVEVVKPAVEVVKSAVEVVKPAVEVVKPAVEVAEICKEELEKKAVEAYKNLIEPSIYTLQDATNDVAAHIPVAMTLEKFDFSFGDNDFDFGGEDEADDNDLNKMDATTQATKFIQCIFLPEKKEFDKKEVVDLVARFYPEYMTDDSNDFDFGGEDEEFDLQAICENEEADDNDLDKMDSKLQEKNLITIMKSFYNLWEDEIFEASMCDAIEAFSHFARGNHAAVEKILLKYE